MIIEFYPNPTSKNVYPISNHQSPSAFEVGQSVLKHISVTEFQRRNAIVKAQYAACTYKKHDLVFPHNLAAFEKHGMCRVIGICETYAEMHDADWPPSDIPFIVHVSPFTPIDVTFNATVGYFRKDRPTK